MKDAAPSYHRRVLPETCVAFSSPEGIATFTRALQAGTMGPFFALSEQFHTQAEPAYCGWVEDRLLSLSLSLSLLASD